ncbi:hypothetical protein HQQ81_19500 [Microbacteriaceae bacterium VKM Ac-2854]|nr:hypothetical protein [Microbacteriaceae bacterium VKM Ac-2854]
MPRSLLLAPAGVGLTAIIDRLNADEEQKMKAGLPRDLEIFYVERELLDHVDWSSSKFVFHSNKKNLRDLLIGVTLRELMGLWTDALERCVVKAGESDASNTVIAFHPSVYSAKRSEQYSTIGWTIASGSFSGVDRVVLLIDDIFDMWERLGKNKGDLFHQSEWLKRRLESQGLDHLVDFSQAVARPQPAEKPDTSREIRPAEKALRTKSGKVRTFERLVVDSSRALLGRIISWRHLDMVEAESLASALGVGLTTLGVKHPRSALQRLLIDEGPKTVYLSHPISRPRRARNRGEEWPPVVTISNALSAEFAREKVVLVCPTAIDEFRLVRTSLPEDLFARPLELSERWPLLVPAEDAIDTSIKSSDRLTHIPIVGAEGAAIGAIARSIETEIYAEVPFRDHFLVTHTNAFFVFRPLYEEGKFSGGVRAEIEHWRQLADYEPERRALFVHTVEDIRLVIDRHVRDFSGERVRNEMRQFLQGRGVGNEEIEEFLRGTMIKAEMLNTEVPEVEVVDGLVKDALRRAASLLFFVSLTALPHSLMDEQRVDVSILQNDTLSASELTRFAGFLRGTLSNVSVVTRAKSAATAEESAEASIWTYLDTVEQLLGMSLETWILRLLGQEQARLSVYL